MKALMLAAGLGTRLRPLTDNLPKPAIPLLGVPLGYWPLYHLIDAGVDELVVNTHYLPEKIVSLYSAVRSEFKSLNFSPEKEKILGSGGGIQNAKKFLSGDFWSVNADEVFLPDDSNVFKKAYQEHKNKKSLATLLVMEHPEAGTKFGAVWCDSSGAVKGFGKTAPNSSLKPYHFIGFQVFSELLFNILPTGESNIFYDVLVNHLSNDNVRVTVVKGQWYETGNMEDLKQATQQLRSHEGKYKSLIQSIQNKFGLIKTEGT